MPFSRGWLQIILRRRDFHELNGCLDLREHRLGHVKFDVAEGVHRVGKEGRAVGVAVIVNGLLLDDHASFG